MVIETRWKRRGQSEFVIDSAGHEYEIATFEGKKGPMEPFVAREALKAVPFGTIVRASVFRKGGTVQFTVDTVAQLPEIDRALEVVRQEARRRVASGAWEEVASYYVPLEPEA